MTEENLIIYRSLQKLEPDLILTQSDLFYGILYLGNLKMSQNIKLL